jgi:hypothetical protein
VELGGASTRWLEQGTKLKSWPQYIHVYVHKISKLFQSFNLVTVTIDHPHVCLTSVPFHYLLEVTVLPSYLMLVYMTRHYHSSASSNTVSASSEHVSSFSLPGKPIFKMNRQIHCEKSVMNVPITTRKFKAPIRDVQPWIPDLGSWKSRWLQKNFMRKGLVRDVKFHDGLMAQCQTLIKPRHHNRWQAWYWGTRAFIQICSSCNIL